MSEYVLPVPPAFVEALAEIVEARVVARLEELAPPRSPWLDVDGAASYLAWPKSRVYKLAAAGAIPHRKHDGRLLFHRAELDAWLERFREGPRA